MLKVLQRFKGRCRGLNWNIEFLHGGDRLTQLGPQAGSRLVQRLQNALFGRGICLFLGQSIAAPATDCFQPNHVVAA